MKIFFLLQLFFLLLASKVSAQSAKEEIQGSWVKMETVTDDKSKISVNEQYLFMSNGSGRYTKSVKQAFNNKRINPSLTILINYSWSIVEGNLKLIFDRESRKTTEANASEEKWKDGAELWMRLLERDYYKKDLAGQTVILTFKKQSADELLLDRVLYKKL